MPIRSGNSVSAPLLEITEQFPLDGEPFAYPLVAACVRGDSGPDVLLVGQQLEWRRVGLHFAWYRGLGFRHDLCRSWNLVPKIPVGDCHWLKITDSTCVSPCRNQ